MTADLRELDWWRGDFPHVVCRMELTDQLRNKALAALRAKMGEGE
jgi:hypothetical protein